MLKYSGELGREHLPGIVIRKGRDEPLRAHPFLTLVVCYQTGKARSMSDATPPLSDDLLIGAEPIGKYIGLDVRAVYHAAATKQIPVF